MVGLEIEFGVEYLISTPSSSDNLAFATYDAPTGGLAVDVEAESIDYTAAPGNGLFWSATKADTTVIESGVLRTKDAGYPFGYGQVWKIACSGNTLDQSGLHLLVTFQEYT
jgi:hypothetical protein